MHGGGGRGKDGEVCFMGKTTHGGGRTRRKEGDLLLSLLISLGQRSGAGKLVVCIWITVYEPKGEGRS